MRTKFPSLFKKSPFFFIILIIFLVSLFQLNSWGITESSEARYAQIAKEMFESGNYMHPTKMGIYHYHKPPLTYYITTLGYYLFGENEFGARFFLSVALLIQLILVYKTSLLLFNDKKTALLAIILYFSTPLVLASVRNLTTDAFLNTFILMAIYFWLRYLDNKKFFLLFYLSLALGFLTKGPLVLIPILVFQSTWYLYHKIRIKLSVYDLIGIVVFFALCGWWYLIIIQENPTIWDYFIKNQLYGRMATKDAFSRGRPFWYYFVFVPLSLFPWLVYIFFSFTKNQRNETNSIKKKVLLSAFLLIILIFSVFKTKLIFYVLPSLFFLVLYCSDQLKNISESLWRKLTFYLYGYFTLIFIVALIALALHKIEVSLVGIIILFLSLLASIFFIKNTDWFYKNIYTLLLNTLAILIFSTYVMKSNELLINSVKPVATFVNSLKSNNVYVYNYLLPSMCFYTNKNIITINNGNYTSKREVQFEQNLNYLKTYYNFEEKKEISRFKANFKTNDAVFLVRKKENLPDYIKTKLQFRHKKYFEKWVLYYN
jgi:4-amino-4-deoxy-L-arabinose transferase